MVSLRCRAHDSRFSLQAQGGCADQVLAPQMIGDARSCIQRLLNFFRGKLRD